MAIGQGWTYERHVTAAWKLIQQTSIEVEPTI
jgi:hypothetical protein